MTRLPSKDSNAKPPSQNFPSFLRSWSTRAFVDGLPEGRDLRFLLLDLEQVDRESGLDPPAERRPTDPLEDLGIGQHFQMGIPAPTFGRVAGKFVLYQVGRPSELGHVETQGDDEEDNKDGR